LRCAFLRTWQIGALSRFIAMSEDGAMCIKLMSNTGKEVIFSVKPTTKLGTIMHAYCKRLRLNIDSVRFLFDGNRMNEGLLVSQAGLEPDDIIDVQEAVEGGGPETNKLRTTASRDFSVSVCDE